MQRFSFPLHVGPQYDAGSEADPPEPVISNSGLEIEWEIGDCRQHRTVPLAPLFVMFREGDRITNFQIDYTIHAKNILEPVEGKLLVLVNQQEFLENRAKESARSGPDDTEGD